MRARRIRNALLASVFTVGLAGATGAGVVLSDSHIARAEAVQVQAPAPADFSAIVETVKPAVVSVQVKTEVEQVARRDMPNMENIPPELREFFRNFGGMPRGFDDEEDGNGRQPYHPRRGMSQGSGFFLTEDGYVVTNAHVVEDAREYTVITDDGRELAAKLIGTDERTDLALLKVDGHDFPYVKLATETPKIGQWVLAVGNPFGLGGTVTAGIISAEGRDIGAGPYDNFLQIDAPVNRGNSGGPTFNTKGEVVGVNTAIFSPSGGNVGIAFAIPANTVQEVVSDLRKDGTVTRGWLGVQIQPVTAGDRRQPRHPLDRRRHGGRRAGRQPRFRGGHRGRRRHHQGERRGGQGAEGAVADDRQSRARPEDHHHGDARRQREGHRRHARQPERVRPEPAGECRAAGFRSSRRNPARWRASD